MGRNQQPTYRVTQIRDVTEYHRIYKVNGSQAKKALKVVHGKAEKEFLLDMVSNGDFTEVRDRGHPTWADSLERSPTLD